MTHFQVDVENDVEDEDIESAPASPVKIVKKKASVKKTPKSSAKKASAIASALASSSSSTDNKTALEPFDPEAQ